jgi:hypothetical protein
MRTICWSVRLLGCGLVSGVLACAGGDLNLPNNNTPVELRAVSGDGQAAPVGSRLPDPLVVRVLDAAQQPVADVPVVFRFQDEFPDAEITPAMPKTDAAGRAEVRVVLGSTAGSQTVEARIDQADLPAGRATFGVTATDKPGDDDNHNKGKGKGGKGHHGG